MYLKKCLLTFILATLPMTSALSSSAKGGDLNGPWPVVGQNQQNSGVAPNNNFINSSNVGSLTKNWTFANLTEQGVSGTPTISAGMVFTANFKGNVYALDEQTGNVIWKQTLMANDRGEAESFEVGPTITQNKVFVANTHMFALNKSTGAVIWDTPIYAPGQFHADAAGNPMIAGSNVIIGVNFDNEIQMPPNGHYTGEYGRIMAFNQDTGQIAWTLPLSAPPNGTGATSFSMAGVDNTRKLIFIGTGNNFEPPASPLEDSLLAINYQTGQLVWKYSYHFGDIWSAVYQLVRDSYHDQDVGSHPNIFSLTINGIQMDFVGCACKDGTYRIFNRDQPDPQHVRPVVQFQLDPGTVIGAILATPVINNGILYINSQALIDNQGNRISLDFAPPFDFVDGNSQILAIDLQKLIQSKVGADICGEGPIPPPPPEAIIWRQVDPVGLGMIFSPTGLSLVNDVLFLTNATGFVRALNAATGQEIFRSVVFTSPTGDQAFVVGGVSIDGKRIFVPFGLLNAQAFGGVVSYTL